MKRDMELVRKILLAIEEWPTNPKSEIPVIEGFDDEDIAHHCFLLREAGLVEGTDDRCMGYHSPISTPTRITWSGYEFLDASRDESVWRKAMNQAKILGGAVSIEIMKALLVGCAKEKLGIGN